MVSAGTGQVDISPRSGMFLWGYPHVERTSTGIHDPLQATALCLDDGVHRTIAVSVDVLYVEAGLVARCRQRIEERTGTAPVGIMITATHTHSAPVTCAVLAMSGDPVLPPPDPAYVAQLEDGIVEAACQAVASREPAAVAITGAPVDGVGCNRLAPDAARDPEAGLVVVRRAQDRAVMAVQLFYAMHPTVLHEDSTLVSADFPGFARLHIEEAFPGARVVYHNGPCGNLSPRYHVQGQTFAEAERLGRRLGGFVVDAIGALDDGDFVTEAVVGGRQAELTLPLRTYPSLAEAEAGLSEARATYERLKREQAGHGAVRTAECVVFGAEEVVTLARAQAEGRLAAVQASHARAEVQVLRVGAAFLIGLPGEVFVEYALEIKQRAAARTFVSSLANGELQGYITTPDAVGYEANLSMFKPESGALLVDAVLALVEAGAV